MAVCFCLFYFIQFFQKDILDFSVLRYSDINFDRERIDPKGDLSDNSLFDGEASKIVNDLFHYSTQGRKAKKQAKIVSSVKMSELLRWLKMILLCLEQQLKLSLR